MNRSATDPELSGRARSYGTAAMLPQNTPRAAHADETWVIALHYGTYGGETVRLAYFMGGLIPVMLLVTGVTHWWLRRRRPQRASELSID